MVAACVSGGDLIASGYSTGLVRTHRVPRMVVRFRHMPTAYLLFSIYFLFLSRGYAQGDLSVVYPISRGMGPALVPISGVLVLNESVSALAVVGIVVVVLGIYTVYWWGRFPTILRNPFHLLGEPSTRYALITGLTIAIYSIWDT